jgi:hypothetical protein
MMRLGMLIDIDHMSERSMTDAFLIAEQVPGYPLNSGHSGLRCLVADASCTERALTAGQYARIGNIHGMAGIGTAGVRAYEWTQMYLAVTQAMGSNGIGAFGTDTNGFALGMPSSTPTGAMFVDSGPHNQCLDAVKALSQTCHGTGQVCAQERIAGNRECDVNYPIPPPVWRCLTNCVHPLPPVQYSSAFPMSSLGNKTWDYNIDGVAHYGMLPDFLQAVRSVPGGANMIDNNLMYGADYFYETWRISEVQSAKVVN